MTRQAGRDISRALADRKGATAIEYALIASMIASIIALCYRVFFERLSTFLGTINF